MWKRTHYKLSFTINKDTSGFVDDVDRSTGGNARMFGRHFLTNQGSVVDMEGQIKQERYLLNGVPFCLMSGDDKRYRVKVTKAVFKVCYAKLNPVLLLARKKHYRSKRPSIHTEKRTSSASVYLRVSIE